MEADRTPRAAARTMLITGATGFIGSRLATLAMSRGCSVRTLTRADWAGVPAVPIEGRQLGNLPSDIPQQAFTGVSVVVHCAAQLDGGHRAALAVNVEGTNRLADQARAAGVETFIFLSSQSARSDSPSTYGRTKYAAERDLLAKTGLRVIVLRPGLVVGPGSRGLFHRLTRLVESLPVVPLLDGGRALVQPIHVDDLCAAIIRCAESAAELDGSVLCLGDPEGLSLAEFLQAIASARLGRRARTIAIPVRLAELAVAAAGALRIRLPIGRDNLKAMKVVARMDTASDLARLGVEVRPLADMLRDDTATGTDPIAPKDRAVRVLLVGAGRVGLVHSLTLSRLRGVVLAGIVDPSKPARSLLRGVGISAPEFATLDAAISRTDPDAVVIATPAATHLSLARAALGRGLATMVEKPLAVRPEQLVDYERLAEEFPERQIQVGYVLLRNPHIASCLADLRAGRFGAVRGFAGVTLLSLIGEGSPDRWETRRERSGGGALINGGAHVLSMIWAAFGEPASMDAETFRLYTREVEDSAAVTLTYPGFAGRHYCSWAIEGYSRQENRLVIVTDRGRLILTGSLGVFVGNDGEVDLRHQLDVDVGFNLAPDYAGAGFTTQLSDLQEAVRTGVSPPVGLRQAIQIERLIFQIYGTSREVTQFRADARVEPSARSVEPSRPPAWSRPETRAIRRVLDARELSPDLARACLEDAPGWDEYLLTPGQVERVARTVGRDRPLRVTIPDFLKHSRLLATGRRAEVLTQLGWRGAIAGARAAVPLLLRARGVTFWVAAMGLLAGDLEAVPADFDGVMLLHSSLTDLALTLRRTDSLEAMLIRLRRARPRARIGFHSNLASEALNALWLLDVPVDEISILTSPGAPHIARTLAEMRKVPGCDRLKLTAEVGLAPAAVHRMAFDAPDAWAVGADSVLLAPAADPRLAPHWRAELEQRWTRVFPGLAMPEETL